MEKTKTEIITMINDINNKKFLLHIRNIIKVAKKLDKK
ncbi:hypothetical protein JOC62_003545 [Clostridium sardiniense]|nr:hypothetical protein [Clostridium sardiniense]